jgi:cell division GTPase FtsZ
MWWSPSQLLQLVRELRAAGIFTAVAVTRPFAFEGPRKIEAADKLIALLRKSAHLVALIEQARFVARFAFHNILSTVWRGWLLIRSTLH